MSDPKWTMRSFGYRRHSLRSELDVLPRNLQRHVGFLYIFICETPASIRRSSLNNTVSATAPSASSAAFAHKQRRLGVSGMVRYLPEFIEAEC
jgi:hypothetical protein